MNFRLLLQLKRSETERCPYYKSKVFMNVGLLDQEGGVRITEVEFIWILDSFGPNELFVIER